MKILHVTPFYEPAPAYGGMARAAGGLCRALARRGHEVTVATARLDPSHPADEVSAGVRIRRFPSVFRGRLVPWAPGLRAFLDAELPKAALVHLHGCRSGVAVTAFRALKADGVPWVLQTHGTFPHHGQHPLSKGVFDRLWGRRIVGAARAVVAVSQAEALELPRPAWVVPNGVEACGAPLPRQRHGSPRVLFVGSGRPQKRGHLLPALLAALPEIALHLVGAFDRRFLRRFRPFAGRVTASGVLDDAGLASAYAAADLLVHPAVGEAFGLVPFEAALAGAPAVVAGGHGCGEWFSRAGGCVFPPDDPGALARAVRARVEDGVTAAREVRAVADFTRRELTCDGAASAMEAVYLGVIDRPRG